MNKKTIHILLVEDNPGDARLFREYLREDELNDYKLDHVERLNIGIQHLALGKPDVVLLDLGLSDSHGLGTFTKVHDQAADVPIVVLTGLADAEHAVEAVRLGAQDYMVKGDLTGSLLIRAIRYAIERKRTQAVLQDSEARTRAIIASNSDGIVIVDGGGTIRFANPSAEALFGRPTEQLIGVAFGFPVSVDKASEIELLRVNGSYVVAEMRAVELPWDGKPAWLLSLRDITERVQIEKAKKEIVKMKAAFLAGVTHDLRTPLSSLIGFLKLMKNDKKMNGAIQDEFLDLALQDAERLVSLTGDVLEASRLESVGKKIELIDVDLRDLITVSLQALEGIARDRGITLHDDNGNLPLNIKADSRGLRRVLDNLIGNAIRYSNPGGTVRIRAARTKASVLVEVVDQGIGIPEKELPHLFQKFYQEDTLIKRSGVGTGLGLYIAIEIVEAYGGTIGVESKPGVGSVFHFTIPVVEETENGV